MKAYRIKVQYGTATTRVQTLVVPSATGHVTSQTWGGSYRGTMAQYMANTFPSSYNGYFAGGGVTGAVHITSNNPESTSRGFTDFIKTYFGNLSV